MTSAEAPTPSVTGPAFVPRADGDPPNDYANDQPRRGAGGDSFPGGVLEQAHRPASNFPAPRPWRPWHGPIALVAAVFTAGISAALAVALAEVVDADLDATSPGLTLATTLVQDAALIGFALLFAATVARPTLAQFGIRPGPVGRGVLTAIGGFLLYVAFQATYISLFGAPEEQTTLRDLGADAGGAATIVVGVAVVGIAPVAEEVFFRGFVFGALRSRYAVLPAALLAGGLFGVIHAPSGIEAVPPLIVLGIVFCLVYEVSGSLFPAIALHAFNNMLAFGSSDAGDWGVAAAVAAVVLVLCFAVPRVLSSRAASGGYALSPRP